MIPLVMLGCRFKQRIEFIWNNLKKVLYGHQKSLQDLQKIIFYTHYYLPLDLHFIVIKYKDQKI